MDRHELAARLRRAREEAGLTQEALARRAHVSRTSVILPIENAEEHEWTPITLARLAVGLGRSWDYLGAAPPADQPSGSPGFLLAAARLARGWALRDLAAASGVSRDTINRLEHGDRSGKLSTWQDLARALNLRLSDLVPEEAALPVDEPTP